MDSQSTTNGKLALTVEGIFEIKRSRRSYITITGKAEEFFDFVSPDSRVTIGAKTYEVGNAERTLQMGQPGRNGILWLRNCNDKTIAKPGDAVWLV